jgi:hypothetical protein
MTVNQNSQYANKASDILKEGRWFRDREGRYVLFRGVNFASRSKLPPYLPVAPLEVKDINRLDLKMELELVKPELDLLKHLGFNIIRLLVSWKAIEPYPNPDLERIVPEGDKYLTKLKEVIDALYLRNLFVILDFHQDIAHETFGGDGFPDWAIALDDKNKKRPVPSNLKNKKWQSAYVLHKLVKHTLKSFWENNLTNQEYDLRNYPVRTHLEKTIGQTVKFFKLLNNQQGHPAILGIEPFNEPHPAGLPNDRFETEYLPKFYLNVESEVRKFDDNIFLFIEPRVSWTYSSGGNDKSIFGPSPFSIRHTFNLELIRNTMTEGKIKPKQIHTYLPSNPGTIDSFRTHGVLSFHYYEPGAVAGSFLKIPENMYKYKREWPDIFAQLVEAAYERDLVPFLTEFGGFQEAEQIRDYINLQFVQIEFHLLNATYWNYDLYNTVEDKDNWNLENYSLLGPNRVPRNLDVMARPYPMRSSAVPSLLSFDIESKWGIIILNGPVIKSPTVIYVPYHIHYSPEFGVWATSDKLKWDKANQILFWYPDKSQETNMIIFGIKKDLDIDQLPNRAKRLSDKTIFVNRFG